MPSKKQELLTTLSVLCRVFFVFFVCVWIVFVLCLVCPMLPVSLDCPFFIGSSVVSSIYLHILRRYIRKRKILDNHRFVENGFRYPNCIKSLKIPRRQSEFVNRSKTDNTIAKRKSTKLHICSTNNVILPSLIIFHETSFHIIIISTSSKNRVSALATSGTMWNLKHSRDRIVHTQSMSPILITRYSVKIIYFVYKQCLMCNYTICLSCQKTFSTKWICLWYVIEDSY